MRSHHLKGKRSNWVRRMAVAP